MKDSLFKALEIFLWGKAVNEAGKAANEAVKVVYSIMSVLTLVICTLGILYFGWHTYMMLQRLMIW